MNAVDKLVPLREVCEFTGLRPNTIRSWAKTGKIKFSKTPTGQMLYPKSQFSNLISIISPPEETQKEQIIYCRVSSNKQQGDLERQIKLLTDKFPSHRLVTDCASGINWKRNGLKSILELSMQGNLSELVVAHKDRLARFGFELIRWIIEKNEGKVIVLDEQDGCKSSEQELAEDLLSIVHIYTCKSMGRRRYTSKNNQSKVISDKGTTNDIKGMVGNNQVSL